MEGEENAGALVRACFLDDAERRGHCRFAIEEKARQLVAHESIREMAMILIYLMYGVASIFRKLLETHKMWSELNRFVWQLWAIREGCGSILRGGGDHRMMSEQKNSSR